MSLQLSSHLSLLQIKHSQPTRVLICKITQGSFKLLNSNINIKQNAIAIFIVGLKTEGNLSSADRPTPYPNAV